MREKPVVKNAVHDVGLEVHKEPLPLCYVTRRDALRSRERPDSSEFFVEDRVTTNTGQADAG